MCLKLAILCFTLLFWHPVMSFETPEVFAKPNQEAHCVATCNSFELQVGKKFYHIGSNLRANWYEAVHICRQMGGHLVNFESSMEIELLTGVVRSNEYWTSANTLQADNTYLSWTTGKPMPFMNWAAGEPSGSGECVQLIQGKLYNADCNTDKYYICQANIV
ncbi:C-type lectin 37Db-like [Drosophila busckii]|uniref:C-type lectin 37Db-like n=1 Tax=Drosophila busckii TaxID=30019 RepID=UPI00083EA436|nr:C-type lectin 37Db-like [Drosophila busckii]